MKILVTGAGGRVGGEVRRILDARAHDRTAPWAPQLAGVDALFLACANVPDQVSFECAAIDAAAAAGVSRIVKLSGPAPSADSPLIFERWHFAVEQHLAASGVPAVVLRPCAFMTNLLAFAGTGTFFAPAADARVAFIDPRDVAAVAAECLTGPGHDGRTYTLTGPAAITYDRVAAALTEAIGRPFSYVPVTEEQARPAVPEEFLAVFAVQRSGRMAATTQTVREVLGREPRSIDVFARDYAELFTSGAEVRI